MGEVYCAWDMALERWVALKIISSKPMPSLMERFRREAWLTAQLDHPNIVSIYDLVEDASPPYIVMQLIEGPRLVEVAREAPRMSLDDIVDILSPIADALDAIHSAGVVHRDVKPDNIILTSARDGSPRPKLIDFGIAAPIETGWEKLTLEGALLGTPLYMAPELALGGAPDRRSDVYSLATIAFELYTGQPPFEKGIPVHLLRRKTIEEAPPPSSLREDAPPELDEIMAAALSRHLQDRPSTASELMARLRAVARRGRVVPGHERRQPRHEPSRLMVSGIAALLLAGLVAFVARAGVWDGASEVRVRPLVEQATDGSTKRPRVNGGEDDPELGNIPQAPVRSRG